MTTEEPPDEPTPPKRVRGHGQSLGRSERCTWIESAFGRGHSRHRIIELVRKRFGVSRRIARIDVDRVVARSTPSNPAEQEALLLEAKRAVQIVARHFTRKLARHAKAKAGELAWLPPAIEIGVGELVLKAAVAGAKIASSGTISSDQLRLLAQAMEAAREGREPKAAINTKMARVQVYYPEAKVTSEPGGDAESPPT